MALDFFAGCLGGMYFESGSNLSQQQFQIKIVFISISFQKGKIFHSFYNLKTMDFLCGPTLSASFNNLTDNNCLRI